MMPLYITGGFLALGLLVLGSYLMIRYPKVWLGAVLLVLVGFFADTGVGLSASEVVSGAFVIGSLIVWTLYKIGSGYTFVRSWTDRFLVAFIILSVTNLIVALLNGINVGDWTVEWLILFLLLYYFPLREYFGRSEQTFRQFLVLSALSCLLMLGYTVADYYMRTQDGYIYAYQVLNSRSRLFAPMFVFGVLMGIPVLFYSKSIVSRLTLFVFILLNLAGILQSFTRTLWASLLAGIPLLIPFFRLRQNLVIAATTVALGISVFTIASIVNPRITSLVVQLIEERFMSSTQLSGGDFSFETRVNEVTAAMKDIRRYPLGGAGLHAKVISWAPIYSYTNEASFIHIGYVYLLHKFGLGLTLIMMMVLIGFSIRNILAAYRIFKDRKDLTLARAITIAMLAMQPTLYASIFTAELFDQRYGIFILVFYFTFIEISSSLINKEEESANSGKPLINPENVITA